MEKWHPILSAVEDPTGVWRLLDSRQDGRVELRRVAGVPRYKAFWGTEHIGWCTTLKTACEGIHGAYLRSHSPGFRSGAPMDWELRDVRN